MLAKLIAKALATQLGMRLIGVRIAAMPPHHDLHDADGTLYMGRWRVVDEDTRAGWWLERLTGYASIRLHRIMRPDHDRDLHNHPFAYRTFILRGFYTETYADGLDGAPCGRGLLRGDTATGSPRHYHRIDAVSEGGVWTLFCMTRNTDKWGFAVGGRFVEATRYLLRHGYSRTHIKEVQA